VICFERPARGAAVEDRGAAAGAVRGGWPGDSLARHLPDPPLKIFDSDRVGASNYAYKRMNSPDGPMMFVNYGVTALLASAWGKRQAQEEPWLPLALSAKTIFDSALALKLAREEWRENRALCAYCQAATLASLASVAVAAPEAIQAARNLLGR
jgi:Vitamin K epoxide reductase family